VPLDRNDANAGAQLPVTVGQIKRRIGSSVSDGLYEGKVAYTADPLNIGRIKVRIPLKNDLTGIELKDSEYSTGAAPVSSLPWAWPCAMPGTFVVPEVGDTVIVGFRQGDPEYPIYLGVIYGVLSDEEVRGADPNQEGIPDKEDLKTNDNLLSDRIGFLNSQEASSTNDLAYYKAVGNDAPPESWELRVTAEPLVRVFASTTRGHSIYAVDEAQKEELTIVDRLGQGLHFLCPVKSTKNRGNLSRRGLGTIKDQGEDKYIRDDAETIYEKWGGKGLKDYASGEVGIVLQGLSDQKFTMSPAYDNYGGTAEIDAVGGKLSILGEGDVAVGPPLPITIGIGDGTEQPPLELLAHGVAEGSGSASGSDLPSGGVSSGAIVPGSVEIWTISAPIAVDNGVEAEALNDPNFGADGRSKPALKKKLSFDNIVPGSLVINATESIEVQEEVLGVGDGTNQPKLNNFSELNISKGSVFLKALVPTEVAANGELKSTVKCYGLFDSVGDNGEGTFSLPGGGETESSTTETAGGKICYADGTILSMPVWSEAIPTGVEITATYKAVANSISLIDDGSNAFISNDENKTPVGGYVVYETGEIKNPPDWNIPPGPSAYITANYQYRIKVPLKVRDRARNDEIDKGYLTGDGSGLVNYSTGTIGALKWEGPLDPTTGIPLIPGEGEKIYAAYRYLNKQPWVAKLEAHESELPSGGGRTVKDKSGAFTQHNKAVRIEEATPEGGGESAAHLEIKDGTVVLEAAGGAKVVLEGKKIYLNP
jgi:hypothetical protein